MSDSDRRRWEKKYAERQPPDRAVPDEWLARCIRDLSARRTGRALDLACGLGHNAVWLAQHGWQVDGLDISPLGLKLGATLAESAGVSVNWIERDLDFVSLESNSLDLICVFRFLDRQRLPSLIQPALRARGWLIYETFLASDDQTSHIRNPDWVLQPDELPQLFPQLEPIRSEEVVRGDVSVARFLGRKLA